MALVGTTKNGRQRLLSCNEPVSRSEIEPGNCASGGSLLAETPAGIVTASSETSMTANGTTSMAVVGVPFIGEASLDEAPRSPHMVPKPPSQFVLDSESVHVFGDEESCLPVRVVSDATRGGKERAGRKRDLDKLDSVCPSTPTYKQGGKERAGRKRDLDKLDSVCPSTPTYKQGGKERAGRKRDLDKLDSVCPSTTYKRRNSLPLSKQPATSAHGGAFLSPMVSGVPRTPLRINHGGMAALEVPSPSSSVLSTPTRSQGEGLVGGASPSPAAAKGDVM